MSYENLTCWADNGRCRLADTVEEMRSNVDYERERREKAEAENARLREAMTYCLSLSNEMVWRWRQELEKALRGEVADA